MMSAFRRAWNVVVEEEGSRDPFFKKVFDDLEKFRAGQAVQNRHLPDDAIYRRYLFVARPA
jgi:hypothetical protein